MNEIRTYANAFGIKPTTVLQNSSHCGGGTWKNWQNGGTCTFRMAEKIRAYMANNPPVEKDEDAA